MLRNNLDNSSDSKNEDGSVFSQTEHNIVAAYLITAGMDVYSINLFFFQMGEEKQFFSISQ